MTFIMTKHNPLRSAAAFKSRPLQRFVQRLLLHRVDELHIVLVTAIS